MQSTNRLFVQSTIALLFVGFSALLGIIGMTIWLGDRAQVYFDDVIDARDTRSSAVELRNAVQSAESSQRGFLISGNEIYLAPYTTARIQARRQLIALQQSLSLHKETEIAAQRLSMIVDQKFVEMDETISLKRNRKDADALGLFRSNRGKALMDEANVFFSGVIRAADERLTTGVGEQKSNASMLRLVSLIGGVVILLVVAAVTLTVRRNTREIADARDEVTLLNSRLERRVKERTADLAQANDEIQQFAYIVTHDLRAPLVNIMGFTSEIEDGVKSLRELIDKTNALDGSSDPVVQNARSAAKADLPEAIGFIRSSTKKMDRLINAILKLSREGRRTLKMESIELAGIIEASASAVRHQLIEAGGEINQHLEVQSIITDRLSLEQVFGNLFDNAIKYRSPHRPLRIEVRTSLASDSRVSIEVADNGRGVADQDRERIFELFRRAGVQDQPGEGIGLAHLRAVIRNLGGDITVTSALDQGTTFRVVLTR